MANAQKSIRTNDIENVGKTARHHTFFEMLGNFSIGDYFKKEAIPFAWEFLTSPEWIGFDKDKLYITVYTDDDEAYRIWTEVCGVDPSHILKTKENFWEIGKGPGGPDTEIHFDRGPEYDPQGLGEKLFFDEMENDRYIEVWNVVFSQYDCDPELDRHDYKELPQKNIDTGMGLERLVALIQGGETNFDTDLFLPIIRATETLSGVPYEGENKMAYRVIADHIRTLVFALSDGASFSNSGRGYVLRRVLRRAVRFGLKLGLDEPFLYKLVPVVAENMKDFYPYLMDSIEKNQKLIRQEEESFKKTLKNGQALLDEEIAQAKESGSDKLSGDVTFKLYDTYGFPFEMTQEIVEENGLKALREEFDAQMAEQKARARAARSKQDSFASQNEELMNFTEACEFNGYDNLEEEGTIIALFKDGHMVDSLEDEGQVILDITPFYVQSGGQVADTGTLSSDTVQANVVDGIKTRNKQHLLQVEVQEGMLKKGDKVLQKVDAKRRMDTTANHSATHLLQSALKSVLGDQIHQAGSYVGPDYLRFDFNHRDKLTAEQLAAIENAVNSMIEDAWPVTKEIMSLEEAQKTGATALFDEKYGDEVRVVTMGDVSKEFCAGCHVNNTEEIGLLKVVGEESIGSDTRRITAKTRKAAYDEFASQQKVLEHIAKTAKANGLKGLDSKIGSSFDQMKAMQKEIGELKNQIFALKSKEWANEAKEINGLHVLTKSLSGMDGKALKDIASSLKGADENMIVCLISSDNGKLTIVAGAGKEAIKRGAHAGKLVKEVAALTNGRGGGKPDLAQAGGTDGSKIKEAFAKVEEMSQNL